MIDTWTLKFLSAALCLSMALHNYNYLNEGSKGGQFAAWNCRSLRSSSDQAVALELRSVRLVSFLSEKSPALLPLVYGREDRVPGA